MNHTVAAVSFSNAAASYTLGGSGGTNSLIINNVGGTGGTGSIAVAAGLQFINAPVELIGSTDFSASSSSALFFSGGISGTGNLSMSGSGSVSIVNSAAGGTIGNAITVNPGGQRTLGGAHSTGTTTISGPISLAGGNLALTAASGGTVQLSAAVSQSAPGSLSTAGPGVVMLSGSNTYSGGTTVGQGVLNAGVGNLGSGPLNLAGGTLQSSALGAPGLTATYNNALNVTQNSDIDLPAGTGDTYQFPSLAIGADMLALSDGTTGAGVTISGATTIGGAATFNVGVNAPLTLAGAVNGTSSITKNGSGILVLGGTGNAFTGSVTINRGAILLNNATALVNSTVTIAASNGLVFGSGITAVTLGGLAGASNEVLQTSGNTPAAVALTVGGNGQGTTYGGTLSGSGSLTLVGGELTLTSTSNPYSGGTTVDAGALILGNGAALSGGGTVTLNGGTLASSGTQTIGSLVDLAGSADIVVNGSKNELTIGGRIVGSNPLLKDGAGTLILSASDNDCDAAVVDAGRLLMTSRGALTNGSSLTVGADAQSIFGDLTAGTHAVFFPAFPVPEPEALVLLEVGALALLAGAFLRRFTSSASRIFPIRRS